MAFDHCPICAGSRRNGHDLVCGSCYRRWADESAIALAGGTYVSLLNWASTAVAALLPALESQRLEAQVELDRLIETIHTEVVAALQKAAKGAMIDRGVWSKAYSDRKQALWAERNGGRLYARVKTLEGRIAFGHHIIEDAAARAVAEVEADTGVEADEVETTPQRRRKGRRAVRSLVSEDQGEDDEDGEGV